MRSSFQGPLLLLSLVVLSVPLILTDLSRPMALVILAAVLGVDLLIMRLPRKGA